jgi:hypothetical protein
MHIPIEHFQWGIRLTIDCAILITVSTTYLNSIQLQDYRYDIIILSENNGQAIERINRDYR